MTKLAVILSAIIGVVLRGWVIVTLWAWFVTPTWKIPAPTIATGIGLGCLVSYIVLGGWNLQTKDESAMEFCLRSLVAPPVLVALAWIVKVI